MAMEHQIFVLWPYNKNKIKFFIYLHVLVVYNLYLGMISLVEKALI